MKIGEARQNYSAQLQAYNEQRNQLSVQRQALKEKMEHSEGGETMYAQEAATLELTYQAVDEKYNEYQKYMDQMMAMWSAKCDQVAGEQQAEAMEEYGIEMGKIMKVAIRIMHGDIVPLTDEQKLMEYDSNLYQMAKNIGMMNERLEKKRYESLWGDEEKKECEDAVEAADGLEAPAGAPEIISVEATMEAAAVTE